MHCARVCVCAWHGATGNGKQERKRKKDDLRARWSFSPDTPWTMLPPRLHAPNAHTPSPSPLIQGEQLCTKCTQRTKKKESKQTATTHLCPLYHIQPCYPSYPPPNFAHTHTTEDVQTCDPCNPCSPCNHVTMQPCNHATMYIHSHSSFFLAFSHA